MTADKITRFGKGLQDRLASLRELEENEHMDHETVRIARAISSALTSNQKKHFMEELLRLQTEAIAEYEDPATYNEWFEDYLNFDDSEAVRNWLGSWECKGTNTLQVQINDCRRKLNALEAVLTKEQRRKWKMYIAIVEKIRAKEIWQERQDRINALKDAKMEDEHYS